MNIKYAERLTMAELLRAFKKAGTRNKAANETGRHRSSTHFAKMWKKAKREGYIEYLGGENGHEITEKGNELLRDDQ